MPTKSKKIKKVIKFKTQHSSGDLVEIQIAVVFHKRPKGTPKNWRPSRELVQSMIRHKAATSTGEWNGYRVVGANEGYTPSGVDLKIIRWRNPDRLADEDQGWRSGDQADAWGSLRRVISSAGF